MTRTMTLLATMLFVMMMAVGCGYTVSFDTGVPARSAEKFLFYVEQEAEARHLDTWRTDGELPGLSIDLDGASLRYGVERDEIVVYVTLDDIEGLSTQELDLLIDDLKLLSDDLIDSARDRARLNDPFGQRELPTATRFVFLTALPA